VISSGAYGLEQHSRVNNEVDFPNSAYNKLRRSDASPIEAVFLHEYAVGISESPYPQYSYPNSKPASVRYSLTNGAYQPVSEFLSGYDATNDLRRQEKQYFHTSITLPNGSVQTFQPTPYFWHDDAALFETASSGKDYVIYSYSDVLLIAAEAIAQSEGVTAEAVGYLSQVRSRAYWKTPEALITAQLTALPAPSFVEEVWKERYRELVFEFKLWFDIVRTRKFPQTNPNNPGQISFVNVIGQTNHWGKIFEEKHMLLPISDAERQRNPSLGAQNPGY
jgi:starch-binding outer membrane protein, SusD/RagB family